MSRSRKKFPMVKDNGRSKSWQKRLANKKVRKADDVEDGKAYRKEYNSWNICDWKWYLPDDKKVRRK